MRNGSEPKDLTAEQDFVKKIENKEKNNGYLDDEIQNRREVARHYLDGIKNPSIKLPSWKNIEQHVFHLFVIQTPKREQIQKYLSDHGIQTLIHYPIAPHEQNAYQGWFDKHYPRTEKIHQTVLSLPMSPTLTCNEIGIVIKAVNEI